MENPYASPPPAFDFSDKSNTTTGPARRRGMVGHVRALGVLMIIQGVLALLAGPLVIGVGVLTGFVISSDPNFPRNADAPDPEAMAWMIGAVYAVFGTATLLAGGLNVYAGWRVYSFQKRTLGIVALATGLLAMFSCYCAPTSIALLIYGLIVLFNPSVKQAFELGDQGVRPDAIDATFSLS